MSLRKTSIKTLLLTGAALSIAGVARAQDSAPTDVGEIVVTATRQAQVLSRVPVSVSAYTQETMDKKGVKSIDDVARFTPGVRFDSGDNSISIRGISSGAGAGTTGIYIDDTPIQMRALGFSADDSLPAIFDLERVEILRGPQGTLFGAGSQGGTVRYITPQPSLTDYSAFARAEIATIAHGGRNYEGGVAVGGPIVQDKLGFRVSAWTRRDGGWVDRVDNASIGAANPRGVVTDANANTGKVSVVRGALAFAPTEALLITPSVQFQKRSTKDNDTFYEAISDREDGVFRKSSPEYRGSTDKFVLPALNIQYDFGAAKLISNTSYFKRNNTTGYDGTIYNLSYYQSLYLDEFGDGAPLYPFLTPTGINQALPYYVSPAVVTNQQRNFTQEVRLQNSSPDDRLTWVAGVFYQRNKQKSVEELVEPGTETLFPFAFGMTLEEYFEYPLFGADSYINETRAKETQIAGFADLTYAVTDRLKVTAGARYAKAKYSFVNFADGSQNYGRTEGAGKSSEKPFTPKLGLSFQADPDNLYYVTWAKGFRVGGANPPVPVDACRESLDAFGLTAAPNSFDSDTVASWEIGSKNRFMGNRLQVAASVYHIEWKGIQQGVTLPSCAIQFTDNLGNARSKGFDFQATFRPVDGLTIDGSVGYTDAEYTSTTQFAANRIIVSKGNSLGAPPWTAALGAQYDFDAMGRDAFVRGDWQYTNKRDGLVPNQDPRNRGFDPENTTPDARSFISLRAGADFGAATVALFVDNLLDKAPLTSRGHSDTDTVLFTQTSVRPRTIGLTMTYRR
jgi:iron complex outermembrane receptor protein